MADLKDLELLNEGVPFWNKNRNSDHRDLSGTDFHQQNLAGVNLACANLQGCDFTDAHLEGADLTGADFGSGERASNLCQANLREAVLRGCDLSGVQGGLQQRQLAGADLTDAKLPEPLTKLFDNLEAVEDISDSARKLFITMLAACVYSWLTIATTTDVNLITNRASSPLPIIQTSIPIVEFYVVAPLLLVCVHFYFHFYLQKLWEELGSLPAIFSDGRRLHERSDPWLLNDLVRAHVSKLRDNRPFMSYFQQLISIVIAWWLVPVTLFLFWERFLPRHDLTGTTLQAVLLALSIAAAVFLYRLAAATLRGAERQSFSLKGHLRSFRAYRAAGTFVAVGAAIMLVSIGAIRGFPPGRQAWWSGEYAGRWSWIPRAMAPIHYYSPFLDLFRTDVSTKPETWSEKNDPDLDLVKGAELSATALKAIPDHETGEPRRQRVMRWRADLRYADAYGAFLAKADLSGVYLEGADLGHSDLRQAHADIEPARLIGADLTGAKLGAAKLPYSELKDAWFLQTDLTQADLSGADLTHAGLMEAKLHGADLTGAILEDACLRFADFRSLDRDHKTTGLTAAALKSARNWNEAYYDDDLVQQLGLHSDNNKVVQAKQKELEEHGQEPVCTSTPVSQQTAEKEQQTNGSQSKQ